MKGLLEAVPPPVVLCAALIVGWCLLGDGGDRVVRIRLPPALIEYLPCADAGPRGHSLARRVFLVWRDNA